MGKKIFFDMVEKLLKEQKKGIKEVVAEVGLKLNTYYSYKNKGNLPRADEAVKIAKILGVSVEYLVTGDRTLFAKDSIEEKKHMYQLLEGLEETIKREKGKFIVS